MKITHSVENALTIIIGVLAFWRVGIRVASVLSFFELPVVSFGPNHALRVCALCAFWQPIGLQRDRVCFGFTRLGVSVVLLLLPVGNGATDYCLLACVSKYD